MPALKVHPDDDAFLEAIRAVPDDNLARLVYAAWLDEHGEDKFAEFIRISCEHDTLGCRDAGRAPLKARMDALSAAHAAGWVGGLSCPFRSTGTSAGASPTFFGRNAR